MRYWGKLLGLAMGAASSGGVSAVIIGLLVGHLFDKARSSRRRTAFSAHSSRQALFYITTFQAMGHLTKSKGRVTEADILAATHVMDRLELRGEARDAAQQAFREGKSRQFPVRGKLRKLRDVCIGRFDMVRLFLEIQLQVAFIDGALHPNERRLLYVFADELGVTRAQFELFLRTMERTTQQSHAQSRHGKGGWSQQGGNAHQRRGQSYDGRSQYQRPPTYPRGPTVESACRTLGVRSHDDAATVKRAYRKLMSEHHPDKVVGKGLSPRMIELSKRKAQDIQAAYEFLKVHKFTR